MKALILKENDRHTIRLLDGLKACDITYDVIGKNGIVLNNKYDIAFVDPSWSFEPALSMINADIIMFFDTEDDPLHFDKGPAYDILKDKVKAYAKMNYVEDDRKDGIKNIGFPLGNFPMLSQIARIEMPDQYCTFKPFICASPTFLGNYKPISDVTHVDYNDTRYLGKHESGNIMYNQRYDWLISLERAGLPYDGGIVFHGEDNLSYEWQSKYFGKGIKQFQVEPMSYKDSINKLLMNRVCLCPTGHERISWRTYDIMATGGILISTEKKKQLALLNPKEYIIIEDEEDLAHTLAIIETNYKEIWKDSQANREIFKGLNPKSVTELFLNQLN